VVNGVGDESGLPPDATLYQFKFVPVATKLATVGLPPQKYCGLDAVGAEGIGAQENCQTQSWQSLH